MAERTTTPAPARAGPALRTDPSDEIVAQERLLRTAARAVRVAVAGSSAVSYGVAELEDAPYLARARAEGIATVARTTGGSGVLHLAGDLIWALVLPRDDPRVGRDYTKAYVRLGAGVVRGLTSVGLVASWRPAPGLVETYCPLSSRGEVLVVEGAIVGGAAQHLTGRALLHHGFVAHRVDRATVDRLFELPSPGPSARLGGLAEVDPALTPERLAEALQDGLTAERAD